MIALIVFGLCPAPLNPKPKGERREQAVSSRMTTFTADNLIHTPEGDNGFALFS